MHETNLTKSQKKHLRELAGRGYEAALSNELDRLQAKFSRWKRGEIDVWDLNDEIHRHHDGPSRELYKLFSSRMYSWQVCWSINHRHLSMADVRPDCRALIERLLEPFEAETQVPAGTTEPEPTDLEK